MLKLAIKIPAGAEGDGMAPPAAELKVLRSFASKRNFKRAGRRIRKAAKDSAWNLTIVS